MDFIKYRDCTINRAHVSATCLSYELTDCPSFQIYLHGAEYLFFTPDLSEETAKDFLQEVEDFIMALGED